MPASLELHRTLRCVCLLGRCRGSLNEFDPRARSARMLQFRLVVAQGVATEGSLSLLLALPLHAAVRSG